MKYFKKLVGNSVYLSPINSDDFAKYTEWMNDLSVSDYTSRTFTVITLEQEKEFLLKNGNDVVRFAIVDLSNDELIGIISLENIDYINRSATFGIFIGNDNSRNKGNGKDAINLMLDFGFNYLNLHNIKLDVLDINERAIRCYKSCGFKEYGIRRECRYINGKYYNIINMDILKTEFNKDYIKNKVVK